MVFAACRVERRTRSGAWVVVKILVVSCDSFEVRISAVEAVAVFCPGFFSTSTADSSS